MNVLTVARRTGAATVVLVAIGALALSVAVRADAIRVSRVLTGSMGDEVPAGAMVVSRPVEAERIERGQVLVFVPPEPFTTPGARPVVHRVIEVTREGNEVLVRTKGDANAAEDPWTINASRSTVFRLGWSSAAAGRLTSLAGRGSAAVVVALVVLLAAGRALALIWRPRQRGRRRVEPARGRRRATA